MLQILCEKCYWYKSYIYENKIAANGRCASPTMKFGSVDYNVVRIEKTPA